MASVSGGIPNLVGGVSQQPVEIRALNSAELLKNTVSDVAQGLLTRPHTEYNGKHDQAIFSDQTIATHTIQKPAGDYEVCIGNDSISVLNLETGLTEPVTIVGAAGNYLDLNDAARNFGFVTIGDTTFIYNRTVTVNGTRYDESGVQGIEDQGIDRLNPNRHGTFWVRQRAGYAANYAIYVNGTRDALNTSETSKPSEITSDLRTQLTSAGHPNVAVSDTVTSLEFAAETDYINGADDLAGEAIYTYNNSVEEFTDLANFDKEGRLVLIEQERAETRDDYWVWYAFGEWKETVGWDAKEVLDASTMPHILFDNGDGTWEFREHTWPGREVGDADSNPTPSFVGNTINSMFLYKGRLCILSDENFLASQQGFFENFYRSTCVQLLDEDRIDIASPSSRGASMYHSRTFDEALLLFSEFDQFKLEGDQNGILSPNTVKLTHVNSYNCSRYAPPVYVGPNIVFVDDYANKNYVALREYQIDRVFGRQVAPFISDGIPELIPSGVFVSSASSSDDVVILLSSGSPNKLWFYNYYFNNNGKAQSSWQYWEFEFHILSARFVADKLVMNFDINGDIVSTTLNFEYGADRNLSDDDILLDYRVSSSDLSMTYANGETEVTLPYSLAFDAEYLLVASIEGESPGSILHPTTISTNTLTFTGDLTSETFYIGIPYEFQWDLNPIFMRDQKLVAIQDGRLQLRGLSFLYNTSGPFDVQITPQSRDTYTSTFSGFRLGSGEDLLSVVGLDSGEFRVKPSGDASSVKIRVIAKTPYRVKFTSVEWDGSYRPRRKRTT